MGALSRAVSVKARIKRRRRLVVPSELWLAIFENGGLSPRDILNVRLTCRTFAALAKAQAFSLFTFQPFVELQRTYGRQPLSNHMFARQSERLEYWTSESIAPLVRWCIIYPVFDVSLPIDEDQSDHGPLLDGFFRILPRFTVLQRLDCRHIPFSDLALSQLCRLGELMTLKLCDCVITANTMPTPLKVRDVSFTSCDTFSTSEDRGNVGWLDVTHPEHIRRICIAFSARRIASLRGIMTRRTPNLYADSGTEIDCVNRHLALILSHPTTLEELCIQVDSWRGEETETELSTFRIPMRSLRIYEGSPHFMNWLTTGEPLRVLTLNHPELNPYTAPNILLRGLQRQSRSIHSLTVRVTDVPETFFKTLFAEYLQLKELAIVARSITADEVIASVTTSLPTGIETLTVDAFYLTPKLSRVWWLKRGLLLKRNLFQIYPALQRVKFTLHGDLVGFEWNRSDSTSKIVRRFNSIAYLCGIRHEDPY